MIVIGAGIIGLSCAWRLSQAGLPVTVFDAGVCGGEASGAAAGMLSPGGEFEEGSELAAMGRRSLELYPAFVEELEHESGLAIDFRRCGAMDLRAARFFPEEAIVSPRDVTRALAEACRHRGVAIFEHRRLRELPVGDEEVLIAAGAWSSSLAPGLPPSVPVRGHLIGYRLAPGVLEPILREGDTYLLQRSSGFLIAGSTTEHVGFDRNVNCGIVRNLHHRACRLLPALEGRAPDESWVGFRPQTEAGLPEIGRIPGTRIWTAYGHYRNGILLAPETARSIAESVSHRASL